MQLALKTGYDTLNLSLADQKVMGVLAGRDVPGMDTDQIQKIISEGIRKNSPPDIGTKRIALIIPDDTRLWARGDLYVPCIINALARLGVEKKQIRIIIALGTHNDIPAHRFSLLAGSVDFQTVQILNSANRNQDRLVKIGKTRRNTSLFMTKEAVEADHIIIFGGVLHHLVAGFGGGRKYIMPGIAGYDSIQQNHALAINPDGTPHPRVQPACLEGNPVHEDLTEAADLFLKNKTCTYVAVAANGKGQIFHADVGPLQTTFLRGCRAVDGVCRIEVPRKADFVLLSAGGHRTDGQLYQATKALFNAVNVVKTGGRVVFVAGCGEGVGNQAFATALKTHHNPHHQIGKQLATEFNMPVYVAFRVMDILDKFKVTLVSQFSEAPTRELGFHYNADLQDFVSQLSGKGYVIPFAENILPVAKGS